MSQTGHIVNNKTYNVGALHLPKLVQIFYEAGYWIARSRASHVTVTSAYTGDTVSRAIGWCVTHYYNPQSAQTMEVVTDPYSESVGQELLTRFLMLLSENPIAAMAFASSVEVQRKSAINRLIALEQIAGDHDRDLARAATQAMHNLTTVMEVCGVLFAVGVCVLSLGVLPAVAAGVAAEGGGQAAAAYLLSNASGLILAKIRSADDPQAMHACAVGFDYNNKMFLAGHAADVAADKCKDMSLKQKQIYQHSQRLVGKLQQLQGQKVSAWRQAKLGTAKAGLGIRGAVAQTKGTMFKGGQYAAKGGSAMLAVVGLFHDIKDVVQQTDDYNKTINQGSDN